MGISSQAQTPASVHVTPSVGQLPVTSLSLSARHDSKQQSVTVVQVSPGPEQHSSSSIMLFFELPFPFLLFDEQLLHSSSNMLGKAVQVPLTELGPGALQWSKKRHSPTVGNCPMWNIATEVNKRPCLDGDINIAMIEVCFRVIVQKNIPGATIGREVGTAFPMFFTITSPLIVAIYVVRCGLSHPHRGQVLCI